MAGLDLDGLDDGAEMTSVSFRVESQGEENKKK